MRRAGTANLVWFFALTFVLTWAAFFGAGALSASLAPLRQPLFLLGTFAPAIVALSLTARADGQAGVAALVSRLFQWRVRARWYAFAVGYMAAIKLVVAFVHRLATGAWPRFGSESWYVIVAAIVISTVVGGQAGEEIGWRGYALPRLSARFGLAWSSVVLGVIWALWHLPLFFVAGIDKSRQSFPLYALQVTAFSVALAWLYAHTDGSLLLAMLMHSAVNQTKDIVPSIEPGATNAFALSSSLPAWLTVGALWVCAIYFLIRMPRLPQTASSGQRLFSPLERTIPM